MADPVRTCAGCGRRAPQADLLRFGSVDGILEPGRPATGRSAYTCRAVECFRRARGRRAFARALRGRVEARPELERLYTDR